MSAMFAASGIWGIQNSNNMTKEEAIGCLRQLYSDANAKNKAALESLIPELAENEDEVKEDLLYYLKESAKGMVGVVSVKKFAKWANWLEKQKEQKPYEPHNWPADKDNLTQEQKPAERSEEEAKKAAEDYANEFPGMTHENDGSTIKDYDKPYNDFMAGVLWEKHQYQPKQEWKPNKKQMGALETARYMMSQSEDFYDTVQILDSLISNLKKL